MSTEPQEYHHYHQDCFRIRVRRVEFFDADDLRLMIQQRSTKKILQPDGTFVERPSVHESLPFQDFRMTRDDAQQLADELYESGIRPSSGAGSAGAMSAAQEHLKDLRKLVFEKPAGAK